MKAVAVSPRARRVGLVNHPDPAPARDGEALVDVLEVGLGGVDRSIAAFELGLPPPGAEYLILGHEALARVVDARGVDLEPGTLVVPLVRRPCGHERCRPCRVGRPDFCATGDYAARGIRKAHGYLCERTIVDAQYLVQVPEHLREVAVLVELLAIAEKALGQAISARARLPLELAAQSWNALTIGGGPLSLLMAMLLTVRGHRVAIYSRESRDSDRARLAARLGVQYLSSAEIGVNGLVERLGSIDVAIDASGASGLALEVLSVLSVNGTFVFTSAPRVGGQTTLGATALVRKLVQRNQVAVGALSADRAASLAAVADLAALDQRWRQPLRQIISAVHQPDQCPALLARWPAAVKHVVRFRD